MRVIRVLRISRILKIIGKWKSLQALISTIMFSLPSLLNVISLLMLIFFIYAILGVFLFQDIKSGEVINPEDYMSFENFGYALLMLFIISTGEDWNSVMFDTMEPKNCHSPYSHCSSSFAPLYFISFVLIVSFVMLKLFELILL